MPTYDYKCEKCGDRFEYFQSMTSDRLTTCSKCGGPLRRLIGEGAASSSRARDSTARITKAGKTRHRNKRRKPVRSDAPKTSESTKTTAAAGAS